jgi:NAD(P)-dependent dehydrogenase (short-subunit alcohol dehydrogenase family)
MKLNDKVIIVTGGARGIGQALCTRFASESPAAIVVADMDEPLATDVARRVAGFARRCDVAKEADVRRVVREVEEQFGRIDLFCANAGIAMSGGVDTPDDQWRRIMDVNFMSHVYSTRAVLPGMLSRGAGYLLHTASAAGLLTQLGSAPYAVSKHAAVALAEWLAVTYKDQGIGVSCLCPQGVLTDMLSGDDPNITMLRDTALTVEQVAEAVVQGLQEERFLILPHPEVADYFRNKALDYDRWLGGMRRLLKKISE